MSSDTSTLRSQRLRIVAQDPAVRVGDKILTAMVDVPVEQLAPGPWGHRVQVVDFDTSTRTLYRPLAYHRTRNGLVVDPYAQAPDETLLDDPGFHAQNVYAIVMRLLARFEYALGRRVSWGFDGHQLKVAPHAFAEANAFYSEREEALLFGHFPGRDGQTVFTCLSHDIVAHETAHALLAGLRQRYTDPSSPDQAGFHEGFADIVALLSVFALPDVVRTLIDLDFKRGPRATSRSAAEGSRLPVAALSPEVLRNSVLLGLADQVGEELSRVRGQPLRASANLPPSPAHYRHSAEFAEPHRRGEILVAAMLNAFLEIWSARLKALDPMGTGWLDRDRVVEEGALVADRLLTMSIRALDYCPPVHLEYGDFLSALLTADSELYPDDNRYRFRETLNTGFRAYGIAPASKGSPAEPGVWLPPATESPRQAINYRRTHFESMLRDPEEVFRFIWENRRVLRLCEGAFTRVQSVRPCLRVAADGFALRETVAEYVQILRLTTREVRGLGIDVPADLPPEAEEIKLFGGGVLLFDEYGRLKFHIHNRIDNRTRQTRRLRALAAFGSFAQTPRSPQRFAALHRLRALGVPVRREEGWM
jgi:hypothetical protein